ncbi:MAG: hypothetical protein UT19_C0013G0040 [Candidatus Woesebacteria bacterium GW2011_GWB1_39_10b]|uniref:Bacterial toxin RNase RnlA/LsoA DBD domain-containing protein n=1 Tax=Candidatus Woesebacteria bacterium GW2011_GWB1_39_10b TaxID=1618573 RepID=A0A0G0PVL6_9BACT|nr:MAG: hypothetical protein US72_C0004G0084 [Microgenomates group bacterium GW2011_GWC1_38_12]KKQ93376.1 MAG: hypothetical protein UT19_C0013G0040 [Candidatus Woesebacteria bacterium GW2011_GWB1_39_10b]
MKIMDTSLDKRVWWNYIDQDLQELLKQALLLVDKVGSWDEKFHDYAFIVFPAAKAYEGFLKTLFHDLGFITDEDFLGRRFRVGKALNPSLESRFRKKESVYDKLVDFCQGKTFPDKLWETWSRGRNLLFHWFPNERNAISFDEAKDRVSEILGTIDLAFKECKIDRK